jgi:hypothetical protein
MDRKKLIAASEGKNAKTGGMNVPEIRKYLIEMKVDTITRINKLLRYDLIILLKSLLQDSKVDTSKEITIQELFLGSTYLNVDIISIIENYMSNDIKLLYELRNRKVLKANDDAKVSLEIKKVEDLENLKSNNYFTFRDGSLNYVLVLETYASIYESKSIDMDNLFLYFDIYNAKSIIIYNLANSIQFEFEYKNGRKDIFDICYTLIFQKDYDNIYTNFNKCINFILNNATKITHLEELSLIHNEENQDEYNHNEGLLPVSKDWKYLKFGDLGPNDIDTELPISCKKLKIPNLSGLTPNYLKYIQVLILDDLPRNNNQLNLVKSMQNLTVLRCLDPMYDKDHFEVIAAFVDYNEGKMDKFHAKIEQLENEIKELKNGDNLENNRTNWAYKILREKRESKISDKSEYLKLLQSGVLFKNFTELTKVVNDRFNLDLDLYLLSVENRFNIVLGDF